MKKNAFLAVILAAVFAVSIVAPAMAVERISPNKNHSGNVGTSTRIWQYGYFDNLIGDGTNAKMYGFKQYVKTVTSSDSTLTAADSGKIIINSESMILNLPDAVAGLNYIIHTAVAALTVNPKDGDRIMGLAAAVGYAVKNSTAGGSLVLFSTTDSKWGAVPYGTWTDVN
jgi:hypothetical protein